MSHDHEGARLPWHKRRNNRVLLGIVALAGVYLLIEHWAHALPYLPWLILLACPLMHVFMHHGHGGHGGHAGHGGDGPQGGAGQAGSRRADPNGGDDG